MLLVCPRCSGSLQPDAQACPRCGLVLTNLASTGPGETPETISPNGRDPQYDSYPDPETITQRGYGEQVTGASVGNTAQYGTTEPAPYQVPVRPSSRTSADYVAPAGESQTGASSLLVPRGAVEMLPSESVVFQLGALYLTNKRVI